MENLRQQIYCYFERKDSINSFKLIEPDSNFIGGVYLMCDKGHVLKYYRRPGGSIVPDVVSTTIIRLEEKYPMFFKSNIPAEVMEHYFYAINFITTEYLAGAAYSIRTLLERLIYDNYGPYFFSEKNYLNSKTDKEELEGIYSKIGNIGFYYFIKTIMDNEFRDEIKEKSDKIQKGMISKPNTNRGNNDIDNLMIMIKKIEDNQGNKIFIEEEHYKKFNIQYDKLSAGLHPRTPINSSEVENALEVVLAGYQRFLEKGNTWRVKYD